MTYDTSSFRRLCSTTLPGGVVKSASSVEILESRLAIPFLTVAVPCERVRQRGVSSRGQTVRTL